MLNIEKYKTIVWEKVISDTKGLSALCMLEIKKVFDSKSIDFLVALPVVLDSLLTNSTINENSIDCSAQNIYAWIAYEHIDDVIDKGIKLKPDYLNFLYLFYKGLNTDVDKYVFDSNSHLDLTVENSMSNETSLYKKSLAIFSPLYLKLRRKIESNTECIDVARDFYIHLLNAKQMSDDVLDIEQDLLTSKTTPASRYYKESIISTAKPEDFYSNCAKFVISECNICEALLNKYHKTEEYEFIHRSFLEPFITAAKPWVR